MTKVSIAQLKDPSLKISVGPMTKEQHERLIREIGYGIAEWQEGYYYRFYYTCDYPFGYSPFSYLHRPDTARSLREVTFDEIQFGGKLIGYKAPYDMYNGAFKAGTVVTHDKPGDAFWFATCWCFPAEWVERDWEPVYEKTVHIEAGDYTIEELEGIIKSNK